MMHQDRRCPVCGGTNEYLYEIDGVLYFYCAGCDSGSKSASEFLSPDDKFKDATGD
jgi:hypothetical protein